MHSILLLSLLTLAGCSAKLVRPAQLVSSEIGYLSRHSVRVRAAFSATPTCTSDGKSLTVEKVDDWYRVSGLTAGTKSTIACGTSSELVEHTVQTLAQSETVLPSGSVIDAAGVVRPFNDCFGHSRSLYYSRSTGRLTLLGQTAVACYAVRDELGWQAIALPFPASAGVDYNTGYGYAELADGTLYAAFNYVAPENVGVSHAYGRIARCKKDCLTASNWESVLMSRPLGQGSNYSFVLGASPNDAKLVYIYQNPENASGGGEIFYRECATTKDCLLESNWSTVVKFPGSANWRPTLFFQNDGGLWVHTNGAGGSAFFCAGSADCTNSSNWANADLITGQTYFVSSAYDTGMWQDGTKLRVMGRMRTPADAWLYAECDTATANCGAITGGVFANFSGAIEISATSTSTDFLWLHRSAIGFFVHYSDDNDGHKTRWRECLGSFAECRSFNSAKWSAASAIDGTDRAWGFYYERNAWVDDEGYPAGTFMPEGALPGVLSYFSK